MHRDLWSKQGELVWYRWRRISGWKIYQLTEDFRLVGLSYDGLEASPDPATCSQGHRAPDPLCHCGYQCYYSLLNATKDMSYFKKPVLAKVESYGMTVEPGSEFPLFRSQFVRPKVIYLNREQAVFADDIARNILWARATILYPGRGFYGIESVKYWFYRFWGLATR